MSFWTIRMSSSRARKIHGLGAAGSHFVISSTSSWTLPAPDAPYGSVVSEAFRASGLDVPKTVVTSTLPVRSTLLSTGRYLSMVPNVVLQFPGKDHAFKALPIALPTTLRPLAIITLKNRTLNPVAQLFRDCAHETAKTVKKKY